jgi:hypothetical protein
MAILLDMHESRNMTRLWFSGDDHPTDTLIKRIVRGKARGNISNEKEMSDILDAYNTGHPIFKAFFAPMGIIAGHAFITGIDDLEFAFESIDMKSY